MKKLLLLIVFSAFSFAAVAADPPASSAPPQGSKRSKSLDFEGEVMEGMNKAPMDSMENIAQKDGAEKQHLYRKRTDYRPEMKALVKELGAQP